MKNLDHILELMLLRWVSVGVVVLLVVLACLSAFYFKWGLRGRMVVAAVAVLGVIWLLAGMPKDYNLILLSGEEDNTAEEGFNYLENHLSDNQLIRLLDQGEKDHSYLASNNVRFYLALIAARRGLHATNAAELSCPRFFAANSYNGFASGLNFPLSYEEFLRKYQETAGHKQAKVNR
jgi:hypothetical protein